MNRTAGTSDDRPFDAAEKEKFVKILHRVSGLYGVRVVAYQVMSNHFHLLVHAPKERLSAGEICRRYNRFHYGKRTLAENSPACQVWRERSRDISWFMRHLQQLFTVWFNQSRPVRRRGCLWADRFKHTILEDGSAVWNCWKYIENNAVRAGMVPDAGSYRFGSCGVWQQSGRHPFAGNVTELMLPMMGMKNLQQLKAIMINELNEEASHRESQGFTVTIARRVRYWTDGLVIGSELFIRSVMIHHHRRAASHRLAASSSSGPPIFAWRRLRAA